MGGFLRDPQPDVPLSRYSAGCCNPGLLSRGLVSSLRAEYKGLRQFIARVCLLARPPFSSLGAREERRGLKDNFHSSHLETQFDR